MRWAFLNSLVHISVDDSIYQSCNIISCRSQKLQRELKDEFSDDFSRNDVESQATQNQPVHSRSTIANLLKPLVNFGNILVKNYDATINPRTYAIDTVTAYPGDNTHR